MLRACIINWKKKPFPSKIPLNYLNQHINKNYRLVLLIIKNMEYILNHQGRSFLLSLDCKYIIFDWSAIGCSNYYFT